MMSSGNIENLSGVRKYMRAGTLNAKQSSHFSWPLKFKHFIPWTTQIQNNAKSPHKTLISLAVGLDTLWI